MDEKTEGLFSGFKGLSEEVLDAIAGGRLTEDQTRWIESVVQYRKKVRNLTYEELLQELAGLAENYGFDDEAKAQIEEIAWSAYNE